MKKFQVQGTKDGTIPEMFGVSNERGAEMDKQFEKIYTHAVKESVKVGGFNACDIVEKFTNEATNENEIHFAIYRASGANAELRGAM